MTSPNNSTREGRKAIAAETLEILKAGSYQFGGQTHDILADIQAATAGTQLHKSQPDFQTRDLACQISVTQESTTAAIQRLHSQGRTAALNFASAQNPGGGFENGAQAQEECLARASALYPCLLTQNEFYDIHIEEHTPLYSHITIWSPEIPFFRDEQDHLCPPFKAGILTCAAPNAARFGSDSHPVLRKTFTDRVDMVIAVAAHHAVDHLILGAWGCGVFKNNPDTVAKIFQNTIQNCYPTQFQSITFAIFCPNGPNDTFKAFQILAP